MAGIGSQYRRAAICGEGHRGDTKLVEDRQIDEAALTFIPGAVSKHPQE